MEALVIPIISSVLAVAVNIIFTIGYNYRQKKKEKQIHIDHGVIILNIKPGDKEENIISIKISLVNHSPAYITITAIDVALYDSSSKREAVRIYVDESGGFKGTPIPYTMPPFFGPLTIEPEHRTKSKIPVQINYFEIKIYRKGAKKDLVAKGEIDYHSNEVQIILI